MNRFLFVLPLLALSTVASAEPGDMPPFTLDPGPHAGNWEATLTGTGQSDDDFDEPNLGVAGSLGYYYSKNVLFTFKQAMLESSANDSTLISARSVMQAAYQWDYAKWQPYMGVNIGGIYGAGVDDEAIVGPEVGIKYFVNESTFVFGNVAYEVPVDDCCRDGVVPYSVGIGFDF